MSFPAVRREITLPAGTHAVYRAWLTPEILQRWMAPASYDCANAEVDERVGGRYSIWHADGDKPVGGMEGEILELVPDERIVWRWAFVGSDRTRKPEFDSLLTVSLASTPDGGTHLTLLHERLDALVEAMPELADQIGGGWQEALDKLAIAIKS